MIRVNFSIESLQLANDRIDRWTMLAKFITERYSSYDGFVIVHELDELEYTASGLSFALENLGKAVIFTSGFRSLDVANNDSSNNLYGSIMLAGGLRIPEVGIFSNEELLRGNRVVRKTCDSIDAFESPNYPALVYFGSDLTINWEFIQPIPFQD